MRKKPTHIPEHQEQPAYKQNRASIGYVAYKRGYRGWSSYSQLIVGQLVPGMKGRGNVQDYELRNISMQANKRMKQTR